MFADRFIKPLCEIVVMLDELFFKKKSDRHRGNYITFAFLITIVGFVTSWLLFPKAVSYTFLLVVTILLIPVFRKLINLEEMKIVRKRNIRHVFKHHADVVEISLFVFLGVFLAVLLIQLVAVNHPDFFNNAFEFQISSIQDVQQETASFTDTLLAGGTITADTFSNVAILLLKTIGLLTIGFVLGAFYGSGGILIIVIAAAQFSTLILYIITSTGEFLGFFLIIALLYLLLLIPLIFSAIAGGIVSKAVIREKLHTKNFKVVLLDGFLLYITGVILSFIFVLLWLGVVRAIITFI